MKKELIAPCGMNCAICMAYLREKRKCPGCREIYINEPVTRAKCRIKNCDELNKNNLKFCYECNKFPCDRMKRLDKRYRTKYHMSMIENLNFIKENGVKKLLEKEINKWTCPKCGGTISCHNGYCYTCELDKLKNRRRQLGWDDD